MICGLPIYSIVLVALFPPPAPPPAQPPQVAVAQNGSDVDETLLNKYRIATDGEGLLTYLRKRTFPEPNAGVLASLIRRLGDDDFSTREKAHAQIIKMGPGALGGLKQALTSADVETQGRVRDLVKLIEDEANPLIQAAVVRMIARRNPKGAGEVLIKYLPFVADEVVTEALVESLAKLTADNGKADPAVLAALKDGLVVKRRAAAVALARAKARAHTAQLHTLLKDPDPKTRVDVSLALVTYLHDKVAVQTMIDLLAELTPEQLWEVESALVAMAADKAPSVSLGTDGVTRKKARDLWNQWWEANQNKIDLSKVDMSLARRFGIVVVHQLGGGRRVVGLAHDKKEAFQFTIVNTYPVDAQVIGKDRLLLTEYTGRRVSVRDLEGRIQETFYLQTNPISGHKLPSGKFFVTLRNELVEISDTGKVEYRYTRPGSDIYRACKLPDGKLALLTSQGQLIYVDSKTNQVINTVAVGFPGTYYGGLDVTPAGNVLIPLQGPQNQVVEYNSKGQAIWKASVQSPTTAVRLPNGHVLVGSFNTSLVSELDRQGRVVWSRNFGGNIYQVRYHH